MGEPAARTPWGWVSPPGTPDQRDVPEAERWQPPARHPGGRAGWAPGGTPQDLGQEGWAKGCSPPVPPAPCFKVPAPQRVDPGALARCPRRQHPLMSVYLGPWSRRAEPHVSLRRRGVGEHPGVRALTATPWHTGAAGPCWGPHGMGTAVRLPQGRGSPPTPPKHCPSPLREQQQPRGAMGWPCQAAKPHSPHSATSNSHAHPSGRAMVAPPPQHPTARPHSPHTCPTAGPRSPHVLPQLPPHQDHPRPLPGTQPPHGGVRSPPGDVTPSPP